MKIIFAIALHISGLLPNTVGDLGFLWYLQPIKSLSPESRDSGGANAARVGLLNQ
jgi:hypothetical protein